jgi:hypothetical protein
LRSANVDGNTEQGDTLRQIGIFRYAGFGHRVTFVGRPEATSVYRYALKYAI